jgi:hypothetical protein
MSPVGADSRLVNYHKHISQFLEINLCTQTPPQHTHIPLLLFVCFERRSLSELRQALNLSSPAYTS